MKKINFMLMSFALLAVVGAALAFEAKEGIDYCTANIPQSGTRPDLCPQATCPNHFVGGPGSPGNFVCIADYDGANCLSAPLCERAEELIQGK